MRRRSLVTLIVALGVGIAAGVLVMLTSKKSPEVATNLRPFFTRVLVFALTGALIGGLFSGALGLLGGLVAGGTVPYIMAHMKFRSRMKKLESDLPTALQFTVNALRAGHALNS